MPTLFGYEINGLDEIIPQTIPKGCKHLKIANEIINTLSENQFSISETRYLFNFILSQFEREMPVTNHRND